MSREIKSLGKHTLVYTVGVVLGKLTSLIMLPVYTRYLTPADYGVMELLAMTMDVIGMLTGMTLTAGVSKFYADYDTPEEKREVVSTTSLAILGLALVVSTIGMFAAPALTRLIIPESGDPLYFRLFFLIYLAQAGEVVPMLYLRIQRRSMLFVALNFGRLLGMLSLNIYLVVYREMGVTGVLLSNLIVAAVYTCGSAVFLATQVGLRFSREKLAAIGRYSYPVMFANMGNFFLVFSDRYFLNHYVDTASVGIYSLGYRFAFILSAFAFMPFQMVWTPQRFQIAKQPDAPQTFARVFFYMNLVLGTMAVGIALFVEDVVRIMADPAFHPAYRYVPFILVAQIIHHWTAFNNLGLLVTSKTMRFLYTSSVGIVVVLALNFLLIPTFGIWGAVAATLGAYAVRFLVVNHFSQRYYRIEYPWGRIARLYLVFAFAVACKYALSVEALVPSLTASVVLASCTIAAVYALILDDTERAYIQKVMGRSRSVISRWAPRG